MINLKQEIIAEDFLSAYFILTFVVGTILTKVPIINMFLIPYYIFDSQLIGLVGGICYATFNSYMNTHHQYQNLKTTEEVANTVNVCMSFKGIDMNYCSIYSFDKSQYETVPAHYTVIYNFLSNQDLWKNVRKIIATLYNTTSQYVIFYGQAVLHYVQEYNKKQN